MKTEKIRIGQTSVQFLLEAADTKGSVAMFEFEVPVGAKVPLPHSHENYDETIYGIEGIITFTLNGKAIDVKPGETLFIPRGAVHGFNNHGNVNVKSLAVITPALIGPNFFKECAEIVNAGGPPDIEKLKVVMNKYGLVPAIPQMA